MAGIPIDQVTKLDQGIRNNIGTQLLSLTLKELFVFRFMQASLVVFDTEASHISLQI